jgi:hypothetical protein
MIAARLRLACALAALTMPAIALAQSEDSGVEERGSDRQRANVVPYIEATQVFTAELEPGDDTVTYTALAAGVDASIAGRNSAASASLRYERRIGWGDDDLEGDTISGVARAGIGVARGVTLEAGALASRTRVEGNGATSVGGFAGIDDSTSQIYSAYAGPSVHTMAGDVEIEGHYRFGYTRVEEPDAVVLAPGAEPTDYFDDSTVHSAHARAGVSPGVVLPVGLGIGGGWNRQDVSNLDQRIDDRHVRADATLPLGPDLALVGGIGYEDVEVSSRDAVRDGAGNPVIGSDGRFVTDRSAPRQIAYQTDGLIWDAGVMWRPSRRTSLEAFVGRRYGTMSYHGMFSYVPNEQHSYHAAVYDNLTSFGGALVNQLAGLPAQFDAFRNPITGEIGGCVAGAEGGTCFGGALGSIRSAVFRSRGVAASYSMSLSRTRIGAGIGYDRRKFIAAAGTVLAGLDGATDETVWLGVYGVTDLDRRSSLSANASINWFDDGQGLSTGNAGYSASIAYNRDLLRGLSGTAALGLDGISRETLPDFLSASALLGLRYSFN